MVCAASIGALSSKARLNAGLLFCATFKQAMIDEKDNRQQNQGAALVGRRQCDRNMH